ncbi:MAG: hypothetical protein GXY38_00485 [Planctomycetes bacterium]|jgi:hypothetical protein|nr:hypothetical protein [Planctomycetota bacterium]
MQSVATHDQLRCAIAVAKQRFDMMRKKHPNVKAYLVLSMLDGQASIDASPVELLSEFPSMVVDDEGKAAALSVMTHLKRLHAASDGLGKEQAAEQKAECKRRLDCALTNLHYKDKCQIEIRFSELDYELIWKLQTDELVDRNLTPQTKASIRIVLGTVASFAAMRSEQCL